MIEFWVTCMLAVHNYLYQCVLNRYISFRELNCNIYRKTNKNVNAFSTWRTSKSFGSSMIAHARLPSSDNFPCKTVSSSLTFFSSNLSLEVSKKAISRHRSSSCSQGIFWNVGFFVSKWKLHFQFSLLWNMIFYELYNNMWSLL